VPEGWTKRAIAHRGVRSLSPVGERAGVRGLRLRAFDLTPRGCPVPVVGALLEDLEQGPVRLTAGYAARLTAAEAIQAACEEAFQSRLTEVQGAREDVALGRSHRAPSWRAATPAERKLPRAAGWSL